jgi:hypothetical protein
MWVPTKSQVDAASRHAITAAGTIIALLGLQAKGIDVQQVTAAIQALGASVNDIVMLIGAGMTVYASMRASHTASPKSQADAVAATGALVVTSPDVAAASSSPNVISRETVSVVNK